MSQKYICFDVETTGLCPKIHNLLTMCMIIVNDNLEEIDRLNISLKHENYTVDAIAMEINKIDLIQHNKISLNKYDAKQYLIEFLKKYSKLIPIGHNINFDINFVKENLLSNEEYNKYFSYNSIDTNTIANFMKMANKLPCKQSVSLTKLSNYFGLTKNIEKEHTSEYDTEMTLLLLKQFISLIN